MLGNVIVEQFLLVLEEEHVGLVPPPLAPAKGNVDKVPNTLAPPAQVQKNIQIADKIVEQMSGSDFKTNA